MITQEKLKEVLRYEPETGKFYWKVPVANQVKVGDEAGCNGRGTKQRYANIKISGKLYLSHRLAWLYMTGTMPKDKIDHINGDTFDNRFRNLRPCNSKENARNSRISSSNTTGDKGLGVNRTKGYTYYRVDLALDNGERVRRQFPYTDEGREMAVNLIRELRERYHGDFARHE